MPLYEYKCQSCGAHFEALRPMRDADAEIGCKKCASKETSRLLSTCNCRSSGGSTQPAASGCGSCAGGHCGSCAH